MQLGGTRQPLNSASLLGQTATIQHNRMRHAKAWHPMEQGAHSLHWQQCALVFGRGIPHRRTAAMHFAVASIFQQYFQHAESDAGELN